MSMWHHVTMWCELYVMALVHQGAYLETGSEYVWFVWKIIPERTGKEMKMWDREEKEANIGTLMNFDFEQPVVVNSTGAL